LSIFKKIAQEYIRKNKTPKHIEKMIFSDIKEFEIKKELKE